MTIRNISPNAKETGSVLATANRPISALTPEPASWHPIPSGWHTVLPASGVQNGAHLHYYRHPALTLSAPEIDCLVRNELVALLEQQTDLCQIIEVDDPHNMSEVGTRAAECADDLKARSRRDLILEIVEQVIIDENIITVAFNRPGLRKLLAPSQSQIKNVEKQSSAPASITREYHLKPCQHGKKLIIRQNDRHATAQPRNRAT